MKDFKHIIVFLIVSIGIIGLVTMPFVQSIQTTQHDEITDEKDTVFKIFPQKIKKSIRNHIENIGNIIDQSPIGTLIKKEVKTSPVWREISAFLFEPKDITFYLKAQHARIVEV